MLLYCFLSTKPELIGLLPCAGTLEDQMTAAFDYWLNDNKAAIKSNVKELNVVSDQFVILRQDPQDWIIFLNKWKIIRILHGDNFAATWDFVTLELGIELCNPKEELDIDEDEEEFFNATSEL